MTGAAVLLLGLVLGSAPAAPAEDKDVSRIDQADFCIPIKIDPSRLGEIRELRLYVSKDRGASWEHVETVKPDQERFAFHAPRDGMYWFTLQVVGTDGKEEPPNVAKARPSQTILVDTTGAGQAVSKKPSTRDEELEALRRKVEALEKRLAELERRQQNKP